MKKRTTAQIVQSLSTIVDELEQHQTKCGNDMHNLEQEIIVLTEKMAYAEKDFNEATTIKINLRDLLGRATN